MRQGDFSELSRVIYDPLTGRPFPGGVIPRERWDPASANVLDQLVPVPNTAGQRAANGQAINNYVINPNQEREDDQFDVRLDHRLGEANRLFVRYSFEKSHRFLPASLPQGDGFANGDSTITAQSVVVNDTHTFGSRWLNELRVGYTVFDLEAVPRGAGEDVAEQMGIPGVNLNEFTTGMSVIAFQQQGMRQLGSGQPLLTDLRSLQVHGRRDLRARRPHVEGRGQRHASLAGDPELGQHPGHLRLQPEPDLELRRAARRRAS